jgi:hypothetical protein
MVADKTNFEIIPFNEVQPGDFVQPDPGHVEIIETVNGNSLTTFAANTDKLPQPEQVGVGGTTTNLASNVYLRYIGTGAQ